MSDAVAIALITGLTTSIAAVVAAWASIRNGAKIEVVREQGDGRATAQESRITRLESQLQQALNTAQVGPATETLKSAPTMEEAGEKTSEDKQVRI